MFVPYAINHGVRIYWTEHGIGSPLLLITGLSFSHEMWYRVLPCLAAHHRVILFDNRGMGRSDVPSGPYTIRRMADDAGAVLEAAGETSADVIGASMGGMIAQELALRSPAVVRRLFLACTSHGGLLARWPKLSRPDGFKWPEGQRRARERAFVPLLYSHTTPLCRIEEDLEVQCRCKWTYKGFWNQFGGILMWSSYLRLPSLRVPTMVVHGDRDCLIPVQNGKVLASRIPGAEFRVISDAGHILTTDQPDACQQIMLEFLEGAASAASCKMMAQKNLVLRDGD